MTCHVCANPTCVDDCVNYPPTGIVIGSAEHKLQQLLVIVDQLTNNHVVGYDWGDDECIHCGAPNKYYTNEGFILIHNQSCPIELLKQFKQTL